MLIGEYNHTIDTKGRVIIPVKFRTELGERFIITKGFDGCLYGYSLEECGKFACATASCAVECVGATAGIGSAEEVLNRYEILKEMK